ncbi:hypothetical protein Micbo1qcDRAFT_164637, partial [Microdochium bolleyi]
MNSGNNRPRMDQRNSRENNGRQQQQRSRPNSRPPPHRQHSMDQARASFDSIDTSESWEMQDLSPLNRQAMTTVAAAPQHHQQPQRDARVRPVIPPKSPELLIKHPVRGILKNPDPARDQALLAQRFSRAEPLEHHAPPAQPQHPPPPPPPRRLEHSSSAPHPPPPMYPPPMPG